MQGLDLGQHVDSAALLREGGADIGFVERDRHVDAAASTHTTSSPRRLWPRSAMKRPAGVVRSSGRTSAMGREPMPGTESTEARRVLVELPFIL